MKRRKFLQIGSAGIASCSMGEFLTSSGLGKLKITDAGYFKKLPDNKVQCQLCPHQCVVADLERGNCGVRENQGGDYKTLVYGDLCAMNIDPIEKKPLYHFHPSSQSLSIATAGCNFFCRFCQNWEISQKRPEQIKSVKYTPERLIRTAISKHCRTIAFTYTEPVIYFEYMFDCAVEGEKKGVSGVMISNGFINSKSMQELCRYIGAVKIDLKAFTDEFYVKWCSGKLQPVLDTLTLLKDQQVWFEIVVLLIPGLNDSPREIESMSKWIVKELGPDVPVHYSRYYPTFMLKNIPPTPEHNLKRAWKITRDQGVKFVYIGNILSKYSHTYCPSCSRILIERIGFTINNRGMINNRCKYCQEIIPGIF
jgi:pyruvate formate lyase activating enzyme